MGVVMYSSSSAITAANSDICNQKVLTLSSMAEFCDGESSAGEKTLPPVICRREIDVDCVEDRVFPTVFIFLECLQLSPCVCVNLYNSPGRKSTYSVSVVSGGCNIQGSLHSFPPPSTVAAVAMPFALLSPRPCSVSPPFPSCYPNSFFLQRSFKRTAVRASKDDDDKPAFSPFGFVTDNPSSRSAIQLPEIPAEDGNVGQVLYRTEDKGKEYGTYVKSGGFRWFVRETGSIESRRGTIVFIHGAPAQSFSYRVVMSQMADYGFHCFAPDWLGFGFSERPQAGYGFDYTENEFHDVFDKLLDTLGITSPFFLVVQGFLVGSYGLTWALKNQSRVSKLTILNTPLTISSPIPGLFQQLRIPLLGEFICQNAVMAERFIEAGSPYVLKLEKADVYRLPYLSSSAPGFALLEAAKKANFRDITSRISAGFSSGSWEKPILIGWGIADKYLPQAVAEEFQNANPKVIKLKTIEGAGHMPQEDWPEKVIEALRVFF